MKLKDAIQIYKKFNEESKKLWDEEKKIQAVTTDAITAEFVLVTHIEQYLSKILCKDVKVLTNMGDLGGWWVTFNRKEKAN